MPDAKIFIDSNILLYGRDRELSHKAEITNGWLRHAVSRGEAFTNLQVLNEVTSVMLRKRQDLTSSEVFASVDEIGMLGTTPINNDTVLGARRIRLATGYSWWDCLLLASALELGCTHFLSEDLQDGQAIEGLTIVDPFAHTPEQILSSR